MELLTQLRERGIQIWLGEDGIKCYPTDRLSPEIIERIKAEKNQIIEILKGEGFISQMGPIVDDVLSRISAQYIPGTLQYIKEYHPTSYKMLMILPEELERYQAEEDVERYRFILGRWHDLWMKAIEIYKQSKERSGRIDTDDIPF